MKAMDKPMRSKCLKSYWIMAEVDLEHSALGCLLPRLRRRTMYEYRFEHIRATLTNPPVQKIELHVGERLLRKLGDEGWEAVSMVPMVSYEGMVTVLFKRETNVSGPTIE